MLDGGWTISPCTSAEVRALAAALGVSEVTASVLARRGYCDPEEAARFLAGDLPGHDPLTLGDMPAALVAIRAAIAAGKKICVHGDYDADGICATALAVLLLRELQADVSWHLPSRFDEGYGLNGQTLERLAADGVELVLTVDCGITAVEEVERAKELGVEVVVTDHHRPGETFPDCPVVATLKGDYAFTGLCGTGVVWKLAEALLGPGHPFLEQHLDLVALATIADVVPLVDENRALALAGLKRLGSTQKPGLRALMEMARVDPAVADEGAIGFRLAPRINAAGRLGRPQAGLHLLLTESRREAELLARELEDLNRERQQVEERILREAVEQIESWPEARQRRRAYVAAGADWHEGVIGIVASRLVERYNRPVVLIAGAEPAWKGSGRSISGFDLHGGLGACSEHLQRYGGHRAAAGLSILPADVEAFADAFGAYADAATRSSRAGSSASSSAPSCSGSRRSASATPASSCSPAAASSSTSAPSARGSTCASASARVAATPAARSHSASAPSSTASGCRAAGTWRSGCRRTAGTARSARSWSSSASSRRPTAMPICGSGSRPSFAVARRRGATTRARSSRSSGSTRSGRSGGACSSRSGSGAC
jgi:single-stranded-DNA-specific exonuclease